MDNLSADMPKEKVAAKTAPAVKVRAKSSAAELEKIKGFAEKAAEIALYYGFAQLRAVQPDEDGVIQVPIIKPLAKKGALAKTKPAPEEQIEGISPIMHSYIEQGMQAFPQPLKLYCNGTLQHEEDAEPAPRSAVDEFALEVLGSTRSISDAMVIFVAIIALREVGFPNIFVDINSLGDNESRKEYQKQLIAYYRKVSAQICTDCRHNLKSHALALLECEKPQCQPHKEKAPQTIAHLSVESKQHFKEVLEFLDALNIVYRINTNLVRGLDFYTHTVFEISEMPKEDESAEAPIVFGVGGRYDGLAKKLGSKKDIPAVGCTLHVPTIINSPHYKAVAARGQKKSKIYFIQIGFEAKLRSMDVLELLRTARIPVMHALAKDSLMQQLATAEKSGVQHAMIFGQKEAIDGTVIIRNLNTRSQEIVKIKDLADYIKREMK